VAESTRTRVRGDTPRHRKLDRAFARALAIALFLHVPLVPSRVFDWVRFAFSHDVGDYDAADASAVVPIDLDLLAREPVAEPPAPAAPPPPAPPPASSGDTPVDAGAPRPRTPPPPDGGAPPADGGGATDGGAPAPVEDPMAAAGAAGKIAAKDPNVQLLLSGRALRKHPLGAFFSRVLLAIPEWRQFFQETPLDPIRDFDHLLITAPQLRSDSSKMVAILATAAPAEQIHEAVDQVVHRANGVWLEDAPVTAARAKVGGAPRLFALLPQKKLMVILPGDAMDQLERLKKAKPFRNSAEGLVVSLLTPARPFGAFFPLPQSLKWMRIAVIPTADGGVDLAIDAGDQSWQDAERHAEQMTRDLERRRKVDVLGLTSVEILDPVTFESSGETIRARTHVSRGKLGQIMAYVEGMVQQRYDAGRR
jgi:hypothetical protein